jgi:hypothetical protein
MKRICVFAGPSAGLRADYQIAAQDLGRTLAPVFNVRSSIGRSDDLVSGRRYYIAEVESLLSRGRGRLIADEVVSLRGIADRVTRH